MRTSIAAVAVASVMVVAASGCGAASTTVTGTATVDRQSPSSTSARHPDPGPVRDDGLQFDVVDVSQTTVVGDAKDPGLSTTARGVFVVVTLLIRNVSDAPLTFSDRYQTLVDSTGRTFTADMAADIYGNRSIRSTRMDPGNELLVHICFDVPRDTVPRDLVLRQSDSSAGVTVPIS
jgi:hypothetical protein